MRVLFSSDLSHNHRYMLKRYGRRQLGSLLAHRTEVDAEQQVPQPFSNQALMAIDPFTTGQEQRTPDQVTHDPAAQGNDACVPVARIVKQPILQLRLGLAALGALSRRHCPNQQLNATSSKSPHEVIRILRAE
jgi:hypothetical protein